MKSYESTENKYLKLKDVYVFLSNIVSVCLLFSDSSYELYKYKDSIPEKYMDWYIVGFGATRVLEETFDSDYRLCEEFYLVESLDERMSYFYSM